MSFTKIQTQKIKADQLSSLQGGFIISTPLVNDPLFTKQVIFISESDDTTTYGFFIGFTLQPTNITDSTTKILKNTIFEKESLYLGGPVSTESLFLIHSNECGSKSTYLINDSVSVTPLEDALNEFIIKPSFFKIVSGYCEWQTGQLEREFKLGYWFSKEFDNDFLFKNYANKWGKCLKDHSINPMSFDFNIGIS